MAPGAWVGLLLQGLEDRGSSPRCEDDKDKDRLERIKRKDCLCRVPSRQGLSMQGKAFVDACRSRWILTGGPTINTSNFKSSAPSQGDSSFPDHYNLARSHAQFCTEKFYSGIVVVLRICTVTPPLNWNCAVRPAAIWRLAFGERARAGLSLIVPERELLPACRSSTPHKREPGLRVVMGIAFVSHQRCHKTWALGRTSRGHLERNIPVGESTYVRIVELELVSFAHDRSDGSWRAIQAEM
ncbi:hypothetical protein FA15DRAFT_658170 [Coprinopsis marcescibilis]|uniref:Uncharacterized protein n=1 Tax=Coprinopsis marcescibilis TaxID=230819 RepID=A0A5C3KMX6_COPMA|nr:hypothetical protein FA15DRAFT_658170 [Coprinopsis marcescibilis]